MLAGTDLPLAFVRWSIEHEWVGSLDDLVERRLMLYSAHTLSRSTLEHLARCLADADVIPSDECATAVDAAQQRLEKYYGRTL